MPFVHHDSLKFPSLKQLNLSLGRVYRVESGTHQGHIYPSITRVLKAQPKPQLEAWKTRVGPVQAEFQRNRGAVRGSSIHTLMECYVGNKVVPMANPVVAELWTRLKPVLTQHIGVVYAQEQDVFSDLMGVAGRMDLLAEWDGVLSVIDLKNAKAPKREEWDSIQGHWQQLTFYACATFECTRVKVPQLVLPIVYPEGVQVFISTPGKHFSKLNQSIDYFYASYEKELDIQATV